MPKRYWTHRVPYRDQPRTVEKANRARAMATNSAANFPPKTVARAAVMTSLPGRVLNSMFTPLQMIASAVREQITMVSTNTSKMP